MQKTIVLSLAALCFFSCKPAIGPADASVPASDTLQVAIEEVNREIRENPDNDDLYLKRARLYQKKGDFQAAYLDAARAAAIDSSDTENLLHLGNFAFAADNFFRAESAYLRCIKLDAKQTDCMAKLAEFYLMRRKYMEAIEYADKALAVDQQLYRPYFIKGWAFLENKDTARAATSFQTAVELNPNFYDGFIMLGSLYAEAKKEVAVDYFNSAITVNPRNTEGYYHKALFFQNSGRFAEAVQVYDQLLAADSTYPQAYYNKGYIKLTEDEQFDSAVFFFSRAISYDAGYYQAYYNRGYSYELMGKKELAASDYKLSLSLRQDYNLAAEGLDRVQ